MEMRQLCAAQNDVYVVYTWEHLDKFTKRWSIRYPLGTKVTARTHHNGAADERLRSKQGSLRQPSQWLDHVTCGVVVEVTKIPGMAEMQRGHRSEGKYRNANRLPLNESCKDVHQNSPS